MVLLSDPRWPKSWPVKEMVTLLMVCPDSPSGLRWVEPGRGRSKELVAGYLDKFTGKWFIRIGERKKVYTCDKLVLMLSGYFPDEEKKICFHLDGVNWNNRLENLEWISHKENRKRRAPLREKALIFHKYSVWNPVRGQYEATYHHPGTGKTIRLGFYNDSYEAHLVAVAHKLENCWNP